MARTEPWSTIQFPVDGISTPTRFLDANVKGILSQVRSPDEDTGRYSTSSVLVDKSYTVRGTCKDECWVHFCHDLNLKTCQTWACRGSIYHPFNPHDGREDRRKYLMKKDLNK